MMLDILFFFFEGMLDILNYFVFHFMCVSMTKIAHYFYLSMLLHAYNCGVGAEVENLKSMNPSRLMVLFMWNSENLHNETHEQSLIWV